MLNVHHLELFYYVATHGGISRAVRKIPYGIQQPAVSGQMSQLEESLGLRLFERSPFKLTPAGEQLYAHVAPFFSGLKGLEQQMRQQAAPVLRIGAAEMVLRHYLPGLVSWLRQKEPRLRLTLRSGYQASLTEGLESGDLDLVIVPLDSKPGKRVQVQPLYSIPLVLMVHRDSPFRTAEELLAADLTQCPLICLAESEAPVRGFRRCLARRRLCWPTAIEASTLEAVKTYVANGYGVGLGLDARRLAEHPEVRLLPLCDADPVEVAVLTVGQPTPLLAAVLEQFRRTLTAQWIRAEQASVSEGARAGTRAGTRAKRRSRA